MGCHIRLKHKKFKVKVRLSEKERAWRLLEVCRSGRNPKITASHPKVVKAAEVVGITRAINYLKRPVAKRDLMARGRRQPGSFGSRQ